MTIEEFQKNETLSSGLAALLRENQTLIIALAVCDQASPANGGANKLGAEPHIVHFQHGVDRGYNLYPQILRLLATPVKATEPVESTYQAEEEKEEQSA